MLDNQVSGVKTFNIGIGFSVLEESKEEFSGFDWMAGTGYTELFAYRKRRSAVDVGVVVAALSFLI